MAKPRSNYRGKRTGAGDMAVDDGNAQTSQPMATVEIRSWQGGSAADCINFLSRKTNVQVQNYRVNGNVIVGSCQPNQATLLRKWSGARFAGHSLEIRVTDAPPSQTSSTIQLLTSFLQQRYNAQLKLLNLTGMKNDALLVGNGLYATPTTASKMFMALMKLAGEQLPEVNSISLEANDIADVNTVQPLVETYPRLLNLSLANNNIQHPGNLTSWTNKLPLLRELVLGGNPVMRPENVNQIIAVFPRLLVLDGVSVRSEADLPPNKLPMPIKQSFFENPQVQQLAMSFLGDFFRLWDSNRDGLVQLYDSMSEFSVSINNTQIPHIASATTNNGSFLPVSRNLAKNSSYQTRQNRIYIGPAAVAEVFKRIPRSRHDLTHVDSFAIDAWQLQGVRQPGDTAIIISIHGRFSEMPSKILRSFDRTFTLLPGPNGSMIVASDMLDVRPLGNLPVPTSAEPQAQQQQLQQQFNQGAASQGAAVPAQASPSPAPAGTPVPMGAGQTNPQQVVQAVMAETRLNAHYADLCAKQANYDLSTALQLFEQSRTQLPPNAYQL